MDLGTAVGAIQLVYDGAGVQQAKTDLQGLNTQGLMTGAAMAAAGAGLNKIGQGVTDFLGDSVGIASDVQAGLLSVEAATGATDEQLQALDQTIGTLGKDTVFSAGEIVDAADAMAKAGIGVEDQVGGALETVANLAAATDESLTTSAGVVADAMAIFRLSGEDTAQVADLTTQAVNSSKIGLGEYAAGFRNLAPIMSSFAGDSEEAIALLEDTGQVVSFFTAQGLKGADAGLSFARMIQNLATPSTEEYAEAIDAAGLSMFDAQGNFIGAEAAIEKVNKAFEGLTDQERVDLMDKLGIGAEAQDVVSTISAVGDEYGEFVDEMEAGNTAAESAAIRMQGLRGAQEAMAGSFDELKRQLGNALIGPLEAITRAITSVINAILGLPGPVLEAVAVFAAVVAIGATVAGAVLAMAGAFAALQAVLGVAGMAVLGGVLAGVAAAAIAAGAAILAYKTNFLGFGDAVDGAIESVKDFGRGFKAAFHRGNVAGLNTAANAVQAFGDALLHATGVDITGFTDRLSAGIQAVATGFQNALNNGMNPAAAALGGFANAAAAVGFDDLASKLYEASTAAELFGDSFRTVQSAAEAAGRTGLGAIIEGIGAALSNVLGMDVSGPFDAIANAIDTIAAAARDAGNALREGLGNALGFIKDSVVPGYLSAVGNLYGTIRDVGAELLSGDWSQAGEMIGNSLASLGEWAGNAAAGLGDLVGQIDFAGIAQSVATALGNALQTVGNLIGAVDWSAVVGAVGQTLSAAFGAVGGWLQGVAQAISDALFQAFNDVGTLITSVNWANVVQTVGDGLSAAFGAIGGWIQDVPQAIGTALGTALSTVGNYLGGLDFSGLVSTVTNAITSAFGGGNSMGGPGERGEAGGGFASIAQTLATNLRSALESVPATLGDLASSFATLASDVATGIQDAFTNMPELDLSAVGDSIREALEAACGVDLTSAFAALGSAVDSLATIFNNFKSAVQPVLTDFVAKLQELSGLGIDAVLTTLGTAVSTLAAAFEALKTHAGPVLTELLGKLRDGALTGAGALFDAIASAVSAIGTALTTLGENLPSLTGMVDAITSFSMPVGLDTLGGIIEGIGTAASNAVDAVKEFFSALGQPDIDASDLNAMGAADAERRLANAMAEGLVPAADQASQALSQEGNFAVNLINNIVSSIGSADWTPVTTAIQAALSNALSGGGAQAGLGGTGVEGGSATGTALATQLVSDIAAAFTPEIFTPIKTAFDAGLQASLGAATAPGGTGPVQPGASGMGIAVAQQLAQDISAAFTPELFAPVKTAFDAALNAAMAAAGGGGEGGGTAIGTTVGTQIMTDIGAAFGQNTAILTGAMTAVMSAVGTTIATGATQWIAEFTNAFTNIQTIVTNGMTAVSTAITTGMTNAESAITTSISAMTTAFTTFAADAATQGQAAGDGFTQGITAGMAAAEGAVQASVDAITSILTSAAEGAHAAGVAVGQGFADGIASMQGAVESAASSLANAASGAIGSALGISSPSKVTMEQGTQVGAGLIEGMGFTMPDVSEAARSLAESIIEPIKERLATQEQVRQSWTPRIQEMAEERGAQRQSFDLSQSELWVNVQAILDGEKMADWTTRQTVGALAQVPGRGGRRGGKLG